MNKPTKKLLFRAYLVGATYTVVGILILNFVYEATGMSRGWEHTTVEGIIAYYFAFLLVAVGAFFMVMTKWMSHPDLQGWLAESLIAILGIAMICAFTYLTSRIPLPD